jgi:hypothetical protein
MEPVAAEWVPYHFQLANCNWSSEPGYLVESASFEMYGSCLQTSAVPSSTEGQHVIEYAAATQQEDPVVKVAHEFQVDIHNMEMKIHDDPIQVFERADHEFQVDVGKKEKKIHRYPQSIRDLDGRYTVPTMVAIGPYHHGQDRLKPVEQVKHVAAYHCIRESGYSVQEMYDAVVSVSYQARSLYDKQVMAGIGDQDFLPMMFYDACFVVQYMLTCTTDHGEMDESLRSFFDSNDNEIFRDLMLLENQLPWPVVEAVMRFRPVPLDVFIDSLRACLQDRKVPEKVAFVLDERYEPPHFLGLLRHYIVGRSTTSLPKLPETESISFSVNAIELSEMGVTLIANRTTELIHMGVKKNGPIFADLSLTPLSLDAARASWLINMAALELCTTPNFQDAEDEASAVCSYLLLFAMIVDRVEDVHELRRKHLLQGGGGLTNKEVLGFLTGLQGLRLGSRYVRTMEEIQNYRSKRRTRTKVHAFVYRYRRTIIVFFSAVGAIVSILGTLGRYVKVR